MFWIIPICILITAWGFFFLILQIKVCAYLTDFFSFWFRIFWIFGKILFVKLCLGFVKLLENLINLSFILIKTTIESSLILYEKLFTSMGWQVVSCRVFVKIVYETLSLWTFNLLSKEKKNLQLSVVELSTLEKRRKKKKKKSVCNYILLGKAFFHLL